MPRLTSFTNQIETGGINFALPWIQDFGTGLGVFPSGNISFNSSVIHNSINPSIYMSAPQTTNFVNPLFAVYPITIEYWMNFGTNAVTSFLQLQNPTSGQALYNQITPYSNSLLAGNGTNGQTGSTTVGFVGNAQNISVGLNVWIHFASVIYSSTNSTTTADTIDFFVNGVRPSSGGFPNALDGTGINHQLTGTTTLQLGTSVFLNSAPNIYFSEIRVSNNRRYTTTFTPPATAFHQDANTISLIRARPAGLPIQGA